MSEFDVIDRMQGPAGVLSRWTYVLDTVRRDGQLVLDRSLTRAELATLFVRALGSFPEGTKAAGPPVFDDTAGHWANGYIGAIEEMECLHLFGTPKNEFRPNHPCTGLDAVRVTLYLLDHRLETNCSVDDILQTACKLGLIASDGAIAGKLTEAVTHDVLVDLLYCAAKVVCLPSGKSVLDTYRALRDGSAAFRRGDDLREV